MKESRDLEAILGSYPAWMQTQAQQLRKLILEMYPKLNEVIHQDDTVLMLNYTITEQASDAFCAVSLHKTHVGLDFNRDVFFDDPDNLLRSAGDLYQSFTIGEDTKLPESYLKDLVRQAYKSSRISPEGFGGEVPVQSILTSVAPKKTKPVRDS